MSKLRDVFWVNIRRGNLKKISESKKTGAGGSGQLTHDETVLDILGREDSDIVFWRESNYCNYSQR